MAFRASYVRTFCMFWAAFAFPMSVFASEFDCDTEEDGYYKDLADTGPTGVKGILYSLFPNVVVSEALPKTTAQDVANNGIDQNVLKSWKAYLKDAGMLKEIDTYGTLHVQTEMLSAETRVDIGSFVAEGKSAVGVCFLNSVEVSIILQDPREFVDSGEWSPSVEKDNLSNSLFWFPPWFDPAVKAAKPRDDENPTILIFTVEKSADPRDGTSWWWPKGEQAILFEPMQAPRLCNTEQRRCVQHAFPSFFLVTNEHVPTISTDDVEVLADAVQSVWDANPPSKEFAKKWGGPNLSHGDAFYYYVTEGNGWNEIVGAGKGVVERLVERIKTLAREYLRRIANDVDKALLRANSYFIRSGTSVWGNVKELNGDTYLRTHVHPISKIVGTFYAKPQCDADFILMDTRRGWVRRLNAIEVKPTKGMSTNFPPWIPHQVKQVECAGKLRISYAANWEKRSRFEKRHPWEYTACGVRECSLLEPYAYATQITKERLWDEPLKKVKEACSNRVGKSEL
eukprot:g2359.t1